MSQDKKPRVFMAFNDPLDHASRLRKTCEVFEHGEKESISYETFKHSVVGMDALIVRPFQTINKEILDCAGPQLKVIGTLSAGLEHIDLDECKRRGVQVGYTPNGPTTAAAELALTLALATARRLVEAREGVYNGDWEKNMQDVLWITGKQIYNSVVGIVGLGKIGYACAKRFKSFEPSKILYCGHHAKPNASEIGAEFVSFSRVLEMSDFVIVTCSLNSTTKHLFNSEAFKQMKKTSILVNVSRGGVVDQDALHEALRTRQIAAAGLDVTTPEPLPPNHKLQSLPNCLVIPHRGTATREAIDDMMTMTVANILAGLKGQPLPSAA